MIRKPRAVKLTSAVYPEDSTKPIVNSNLDALIKFALMNPQKLPDIGKYIFEKRVKKALAKQEYGYVKISLELFNSIIQSCTANLLTFYAPYVVGSLQEIFRQEKALTTGNVNINTEFLHLMNDLKLQSTETFIKFAKQRYNNLTEYQDLGFFLEYFSDMCAYESQDKETRKRMRICGLRGLYNYITTVEDLDSFVAKYVDIQRNTRVMPSILSNLLEFFKEVEPDNKSEDEEPKGIRKLSITCLNELARTVSPITIQSLLTAITSFLDSKQVWMHEAFANECIKAISVKPQHNQIIVSQLLYHLERVTDADIKVAIVQVLVFFFEGIAKGPIGPVVEVLIPLIGHLLSSVSKRQSSSNAEPDKFQSAIIRCIGMLGKRVNDPSEKIEAMTYIMDRIKVSDSNPAATNLLLQCVLQIALNFRELPTSRDLPSKIVVPLLGLSLSPDQGVRVIVLQIFQSLIFDKSANKVIQKPSSDPTEIKKRYKALRTSLYKHALLDSNEPDNFMVIYDSLNILLNASGARELQYSLPLVFKLENLVKEHKLASHLERSVHSVVAAYLFQIAKAFLCPTLENYIIEIMNGLAEKTEFSRVFVWKPDSFTLRKNKFKDKYRKTKPVTKFIEPEAVVSFLSEVPAISQEYAGKDIRQLFLRDLPADELSTSSDFKVEKLGNSNKEDDSHREEAVTASQEISTKPTATITASMLVNIFEDERKPATQPSTPPDTNAKTRSASVWSRDTRSESGVTSTSRDRSQSVAASRSEPSVNKPPESPLPVETSRKEKKFVPPPKLSFAEMVTSCAKQDSERTESLEYVMSLFPSTVKEAKHGESDAELSSSSTLKLQFPLLAHATSI